MYQQTIEKSVTISGVGLHSGQYVTMEVQPAPACHGIVFVRTDLPEKPKIPAILSSLDHRMRCTALMSPQGGVVYTIEHFLATCFAMQLDNLLINISGPEVPGMDGSALPFYQTLKTAGKVQQSEPASVISITEEIQVQEKKASLKATPHSHLTLQYHLVYDIPGFPEQTVEFEISETIFAQEIAPARTFALKQEVDTLLKLGLGKGANLQNTLILDDHGQVISNHLRFPNEFARHKLLDLLGDLALLGTRIQSKIQAERSGHELNACLARAIQTQSKKI